MRVISRYFPDRFQAFGNLIVRELFFLVSQGVAEVSARMSLQSSFLGSPLWLPLSGDPPLEKLAAPPHGQTLVSL